MHDVSPVQDGNGTIEFVEFMDAVEYYGRMATDTSGGPPRKKIQRGRKGNDLLYLDFPKHFQFPLKNPYY